MVTELNVGIGEHGVKLVHHMPQDDGVYMKEIFVPAGKELFPHKHSFTHKSLLASGSALLRKEGENEIEICGPIVLQIAKGVQHSVVALTDVVWFCIHATDEQDEEMIDHTLVRED